MQVYGGLVYMDFEEKHMKQYGRGRSAGTNPPLIVLSDLSIVSMPALQCQKSAALKVIVSFQGGAA